MLPNSSIYREPDEVAAAIELALFEPREPAPKRRYLVVSNQHEARRTIGRQMEQLVQLNERHRFTYDGNTLIQMLDERLSQLNSRYRDCGFEFPSI